MALLWTEGFENEDRSFHFERKYDNFVGDADDVRVSGRKTGFAFSPDDVEMTTPALLGSVGNEWFIGFGFRMDPNVSYAVPPSSERGFVFRDDGDNQLRLEIQLQTVANAEGQGAKIRVMRGATELDVSDTTLYEGYWYYIEFRATIHPSTGSYETRIDGVTDAGATDSSGSANTAEQGTAGADRVHFDFAGQNSDPFEWDDIYILDDTGGAPQNTWLGASVVVGLQPEDGDGDTADWNLADGASNVGDAPPQGGQRRHRGGRGAALL